MGGLNPPLRASPRLVFPPPRPGAGANIIPKGQPQRATPLGVFPLESSPDGPPNLGIAGIRWGVFLVASLPIFTDLYRLSWEIILSRSRVVFTLDYLFYMHVFFQMMSSGGITSSIV